MFLIGCDYVCLGWMARGLITRVELPSPSMISRLVWPAQACRQRFHTLPPPLKNTVIFVRKETGAAFNFLVESKVSHPDVIRVKLRWNSSYSQDTQVKEQGIFNAFENKALSSLTFEMQIIIWIKYRGWIWGKIPQDCRACCSSKCLLDQNLFHKTRIFMRKSFLRT